MPQLTRLTYLGLAIATCLSLVAGCSGPGSSSASPYRLSATATVALGDVLVSGTTNLPDRGVVTIYAWSETDDPHREWTGYATVLAGSFSGHVPTATWQAQTIHLSLAIAGDVHQSPEVLAVIGRDGSLLSGDDVQTGEDGSRIIESRLDVDRQGPSQT